MMIIDLIKTQFNNLLKYHLIHHNLIQGFNKDIKKSAHFYMQILLVLI
jgi:hypothetical protein